MAEPRERPILFSAPMVRALLAGTKTQTRRVMSEKHCWHFIEATGDLALCPYGRPGTRLWVRETFVERSGDLFYRADGESEADSAYWVCFGERIKRWKPAIHMPRWASRITLEVTDVRVERLQDISESDAEAEGVLLMYPDDVRGASHALAYSWLWDSINGAGSWAANPWVWVVEFRRIEGQP